MKINEENKRKRGFVITGTLIAWAIGMIAVLGTSSYIANKTLNKQADSRFNNINRKNHDFISKYSSLDNSSLEELSKVEINGLISMREEEKLARDIYHTLYKKWGLNVFNNISYSENRHTLAIKTLLDKYEINDPVEDDTTGVFTIDKIQNLYDVLLKQGNTSLIDALKVGVTIEDLDIYDLNKWIEDTNNNDIRMIYENLERGSRNHMRSFMFQLKLNNGKYNAQYLSQDEINDIILSGQERGAQRRINNNHIFDKRINGKKLHDDRIKVKDQEHGNMKGRDIKHGNGINFYR